MPSRDVELDLIGHDHTGHATRSAANNLDQLRRKMGKFNVDTDRDLKRGFGRSGVNAASAFAGSFTRVLTGGLLGRQSFAQSFAKSPGFAVGGAIAGAVFAAKLIATAGQAIQAGLPLVLGAAIVALPFVHLVKTQKAAVDKLKTQWGSFTNFISRPLKLPFLATLKEVGAGLDRLKAPFASLVKSIGPALKPLTRGVFDGIIAFVKALQPAMPGIVAGLKEWATQFPIIAKSAGDFLAGFLKDPAAVQKSVQSISLFIQDVLKIGGVIGGAALAIGNFFTWFDSSAIGLTAATQGITTAFYTMAIGAVKAISWLLDAWATINPLMAGPAAAVHRMLAGLEAAFIVTKSGWASTAAAINKQKIVAKIQANIDDLDAKIAAAKAKLKTVHNAKARAKIEATIKDLEAKAAAARHQLARVQGTRTVAKIKAEIRDLDAKVKAAKARLKTVHNAKTEAKIRANIADLQAKAAAARRELASIHGKTVTVTLNTIKRTSNVATPHKGLRVASAGDPWAGAAGGSYRTGGPRSINVEAPIIDTRVIIDGRDIRTVARSTVVDENRRAAHRARVGRR